MSTFAEHVAACTVDGVADLNTAQARRADELMADEGAVIDLALKAAEAERHRWERGNADRRNDTFKQDTLDGMDLDVLIPLGASVYVRHGSMNAERIRARMDLRTTSHLDESRAYDREMSHWLSVLPMIADGNIDGLAGS
jgi:hypothetical protein